MEDSTSQLIKVLNRQLREKNEDIRYLKYLLELTFGGGEPEPIPTRQEEPCGKMVIDGLVAEILAG